MKPKISTISVVFTFVAAMLLATVTAGAEDLFPTFTDCNTVGLWLFDETQYPHTTLLDAGEYEYDLRLLQI